MTDFQVSEKIIDLNLLYNKLNHTNKEHFKFYTNKENFKKYLFVDYNILWSSEDNVSLYDVINCIKTHIKEEINNLQLL